jgi:hypothetical protein
MKQDDPLRTEFYKVEYIYQEKTHYACYFQLKSAQEAMMKMISRGVTVNGLHTHKPKLEIIGTVRKAAHRNS